MREQDKSELRDLLDSLIRDAKALKEDDLEKFFNIKQRTANLIKLFFRQSKFLINQLNALNYDAYLTSRDRRKLVGFFAMLTDRLHFPRSLKGAPNSSSPRVSFTSNRVVFIGHGRSRLWARVKVFLEDRSDLDLRTVHYESESRVGESIVSVLEGMLQEARFAVTILTAEDTTSSGSTRARQNVIHEIGLFQGRLGFKRVVLLVQEGVEAFSNLAGLQHLPFSGDNIETTFTELRAVLQREGMVG